MRPWHGFAEAHLESTTPYTLRLAEMKRVAAQIADKEPPIDVLIDNAGALFASRRLTEGGLECTFALNHMAYFVVTAGLRERLLASGAARIINTASAAHENSLSPIRGCRADRQRRPGRTISLVNVMARSGGRDMGRR